MCLGDIAVSTWGHPPLGQCRGSGLTNELGLCSPQSPGTRGRGDYLGSSPVRALGQALLFLLSLAPVASHGCPRAGTWGVSTWENYRQLQMPWSKCWGAALPIVGDPSPAWGGTCIPPPKDARSAGCADPLKGAPVHQELPALGLRVCKETRPASLETWMWAGSPSWEPATMGRTFPGAHTLYGAKASVCSSWWHRCPSLPYHCRIRSRRGAGHAAPHPAPRRHQDSHGQTRLRAARHRTAAG